MCDVVLHVLRGLFANVLGAMWIEGVSDVDDKLHVAQLLQHEHTTRHDVHIEST